MLAPKRARKQQSIPAVLPAELHSHGTSVGWLQAQKHSSICRKPTAMQRVAAECSETSGAMRSGTDGGLTRSKRSDPTLRSARKTALDRGLKWSGTPGSNRRPSPWQFGRSAFTDLPGAPLPAQVVNFTRDGTTARSTNLPGRTAKTPISGSNWGPRCPALRRRRGSPTSRVHRDCVRALRPSRAGASSNPECDPHRPSRPDRVFG